MTKKNPFFLLFAVTLLAACSVFSTAAQAVGVGAASVNSRLGEPLQVSIPVFSVSNPDALVLSVKSDMFGGDPARQLSAVLERENSQLSVRVFTPWPVMEPYISFELEVQDGGIRQAKDFVLLLEFRPTTGVNDPLRVPNQDVATAAPQNEVGARQVRIERIDSARSAGGSAAPIAGGRVMGPYDWAQRGQIAESFGPVIDGQSLWRVARRINGAMGVSVEQMMVALYEANPEAFFSSSLDSLKAGAILNIPAPEVVRSLSASEAESRVDELTEPVSLNQAPTQQGTVTTLPAPPTAQPEDVNLKSEVVSESEAESSNEQVPAEAEPLFVIGDSEDLAAAASGAAVTDTVSNPSAGQNQQRIIDSLSKTIGDLMRDNVDKEQRLQSMDERLQALEATLDDVGLAGSGAPATSPVPGTEESPRWWLWILPLLAGIGIWLGIRARRDIVTPGAELFDERTDDDVEPNSIHVVGDEPLKQGFEEYSSSTDFSVMRSTRQKHPEDEEGDENIEGVSYEEFDNEYLKDEENDDRAVGSTLEFDSSNVAEFPSGPKRNLEEAIDTFIEERDFTAARDALDAARGKELDEPNYHFQRLRILLEKNDEHGFYEYFNLVENKFQDVDQDLKLGLADLVSRLNQKS